MNIKRVLPTLLVASLIGSPQLQASENETMFLANQGKLVIPHLILGNEIYYVQLNRTSPNGYNFNLDAATVTKITPRPGDDWASATEVVGNWRPEGIPGVTLSIKGDGTYSLFNPAEEDCPAGVETGLWTLDEDTGVFVARALTDANGECGLSHPDGVARVKRVGANLDLMLNETEGGKQTTVQIKLIPG